MAIRKTIVGHVDAAVLAFTAGKDVQLDLALAEADCIGTAAHVTMLSRMPGVNILTERDRNAVVRELITIMRAARRGTFRIRPEDQDVHLAVERLLTQKLGHVGKRVHTARSRNDQVATDLRLYAKERLLTLQDRMADLAGALLRLARRHVNVPMVGRTHLQPAMPSSVGLWASAHAESLLDDAILLRAAYDVNNRCPLGSAASYGVSLPIDRALTARLLGFHGPHQNVLYAGNGRGKCESAILASLAQVMVTLSRFAEDLILFAMPEFGYFTMPAAFGTGSSIMPQKNNPDVLELIRARAKIVSAHSAAVTAIVQGLPSGYSRDLQETKEPFLEGLRVTAACVDVLVPFVEQLRVNRQKLLAGFTPAVFATDRALELVAGGMPFRDAYDQVKANLGELSMVNPKLAIRAKTHLGAPGGLDFRGFAARVHQEHRHVAAERRRFHGAVTRLLGVDYPALG
ncbi:MAG: argininosuccinate lyase [Verrucomicrobia bacterium]|nr:argininosuccinate lyase [Verrucomicrobiota bacterium]